MNKPESIVSSFNRVPQMSGAPVSKTVVSTAPSVIPAVIDLLARRNIKGMLPVIPKGVVKPVVRTDVIKEIVKPVVIVTDEVPAQFVPIATKVTAANVIAKQTKKPEAVKAKPVAKAAPVAKKEVAKKPVQAVKSIPKKVIVSKVPVKVSKVPQKKTK